MKHVKYLVAVLAVLASALAPALADPAGSRASLQPNGSSTITVTNTFQQVFAANPQRYACTLQNNGTHTMFVFLGPLTSASATTSGAIQLAAGVALSCNNSSTTFNDPVNITGTSGDAFYAQQW